MAELLLREMNHLHTPVPLKEFLSFSCGWGEDMKKLKPWRKGGPGFMKSLSGEDQPRILIAGRTASLMDLIRAGEIPERISGWDSMLAFMQEEGRGRLGRKWSSLPGNITGALRLPIPPEEYRSLLPLIIGYITASFISGQGPSVKVKWPNDLILDSGKAGGILIEEKGGVIIAGIGINLYAAPEVSANDSPPEEYPPAALSAYPAKLPGPVSFWSQLVKEIQIKYNYLTNNLTPGEFVKEFSSRMALLSEKILMTGPGGEEVRGLLTGLTEEGALRVSTEGGERIFLNGSLRPA